MQRFSIVSRSSRAAACLLPLLVAGLAGAQPVPSPELDRLSQIAAREGKVRVIVGLNLSTRPEGFLKAQEVAQQRSAIKAAQAAVVDRLLAGTAVKAHARFETIPFFAAEVDANAMARLRASSLVNDVQEDRLAKTSLLQSVPLIHAPLAWSAGDSGAGWTVAVLDTGVDKSHPFLAGKVVSEACYSTNYNSTTQVSQSLCPNGVSSSTAVGSGLNCDVAAYGSACQHGTHVAGIATGTLAPDGSSGVAKDAGLIAVQVFSYFPSVNGSTAGLASYTSDQILGLQRVLALSSQYKIASVNMSLGGGRYYSTCDAVYSSTKAAIDNLRSVGIATVIASGNNGYTDSISAPACVSSAVSVGATCDANDSGSGYCAAGVNGVTSYSNIASFVSLLAPGSYITSSVPGGGYATWSGTSMATPHVAGAWAVLKQALPSIGVTDALNHLRNTGLTVNDTRLGATVSGLKRIDLSTMPVAVVTNTLSVTRLGTGSGSVSSSPSGISCGSSCSASFASGTAVTLTAQAAQGSVFSGWGGACTGTASTCTVSMASAQAVTATFTLPVYTLTVSLSGTGKGSVSSSPAGISCGSTCSASFNSGTSVKLTAAPAAGNKFAGWSGACSGSSTSCTVSMSSARSVTASFR